MRTVDNTEDLIDTRDLITAIEDLEGDFEALTEAVDEAQEAYDDFNESSESLRDDGGKAAELHDDLAAAREALADWDGGEELASLKAFAEQVEGYAADYLHGETLIRESYFTDYAEELVKECYGLPQDLPSWIVIDWEATANNIKVDYSEAEFDGVTYYFR